MITPDQTLEIADDDTPSFHSLLVPEKAFNIVAEAGTEGTAETSTQTFLDFFRSLERPDGQEITQKLWPAVICRNQPLSLDAAVDNYFYFVAPYVASYNWLQNYFVKRGAAAAKKAFDRLSVVRKAMVCMGHFLRFPHQAKDMYVPGLLFDGGIRLVNAHVRSDVTSEFDFPASSGGGGY